MEILPAPLIIFATFVGFTARGSLGALVMTTAMFLPVFAFTLIGYSALLRESLRAKKRVLSWTELRLRLWADVVIHDASQIYIELRYAWPEICRSRAPASECNFLVFNAHVDYNPI